jgi:hypothetical protein
MCATHSLRGQPLTNVPVDLFIRETSRHLKDYSRAFWFWWPIIHARAEHHRASAADLLLNPALPLGIPEPLVETRRVRGGDSVA